MTRDLRLRRDPYQELPVHRESADESLRRMERDLSGGISPLVRRAFVIAAITVIALGAMAFVSCNRLKTLEAYADSNDAFIAEVVEWARQ